MNTDKDLKIFFEGFEPELKDEEVFMSRLSERLDAIECVKRERDAQIKIYRRMMVFAFVLGVFTGGGFFALMHFAPDDMSIFNFDMDLLPLVYRPYSREISMILLSFVVSLVIMLISNVTYDTYMQRKKNMSFV